MSEFSRHIKAYQTGNRKAVLPDMLVVHDAFAKPYPSIEALTEYRIGCELRVVSYARNAEELGRIQEMARRQIEEEVFGEFRKPLYQLHEALHRRGFEEGSGIVREILHSMFEE